MACVHLGAQLARHEKITQKQAGEVVKPKELDVHNLALLESNVDKELRRVYDTSVGGIYRNLTAYGVVKFLALAMSPFNVC